MSNKRFFIILIIVIFISCKNENTKHKLEKIKVFDSEKNISTVFYLNSEKQKDSIEEVYDSGVVTKEILWKNGMIKSINNFDKTGFVSRNTILKDSILYTYDDEKKIIQKSTINMEGLLHGKSIKYEDSKIVGISNYIDGKINGLTVHFDKTEYPSLIGDFVDGSFYFGIQFHESSRKVKSLRVNDRRSKIGLIYNYHLNGQIMNKIELKDGKADGVKYEFSKEGDTISSHNYLNGIIKIDK